MSDISVLGFYVKSWRGVGGVAEGNFRRYNVFPKKLIPISFAAQKHFTIAI